MGCSPSRSIQGGEPPLVTGSCVRLCFSVKLRTQKKEKHEAPTVQTLHGSTDFIAILPKVLVQGKGFTLTFESSY